MIRFEEEKLVIEIKTCSRAYAVETWLNLQKELLYIIRWMGQDNISNDFYVIPDFMDVLLPDFEQAIKMIKD